MTVRADLAAAANTVLGANRCAPFYRQSPRPGDAWVSRAGLTRDDTGLGFMSGWEVRVSLSQDLATAEEWFDAKVDDLTEALAEHLVITSASLVTLALDTGTTPGLIIEGVRPHERNE